MAVTVFTQTPAALLAAIKKSIDDKEVETWGYDDEGDFFCTPPDSAEKAWFRPIVQQATLTFGLIGKENEAMTSLIYGVYHGRLIEMLLVHFDQRFTHVSATALGDSVDVFT